MQPTIMRPAGESERALSRRFQFNRESLAAVKPPATDRVYVYDTKTPHLAFMVTANNARSYVWYGRVTGERHPVKARIGTVEQITLDGARKKAADWTANALRGINPLAAKRAAQVKAEGPMTLEKLFEWYEANHAKPRKSSWKNDRQLYDTHLKKKWGHRPADQFEQEDLIGIHSKLGEAKKPVTGNRLLSLVSRMYNVARKRRSLNFTVANPAEGIERFNEAPRDEWLKTDSQLHAWNAAVDAEESEDMRDFLRMALYTGARRSNVLSMRWDEVDMGGKLWSIPKEKAKAREVIDVPLADEAMAILERRKSNGSEWVFPAGSASGHLCEPKKAWASVIKRANLPRLHLHDLRRSCACLMHRRGVDVLTIQKVMGHKDIKTTLRYVQADPEKKREALHLAADAIRQAIAPPKPQKKATRKKK